VDLAYPNNLIMGHDPDGQLWPCFGKDPRFIEKRSSRREEQVLLHIRDGEIALTLATEGKTESGRTGSGTGGEKEGARSRE